MIKVLLFFILPIYLLIGIGLVLTMNFYCGYNNAALKFQQNYIKENPGNIAKGFRKEINQWQKYKWYRILTRIKILLFWFPIMIFQVIKKIFLS